MTESFRLSVLLLHAKVWASVSLTIFEFFETRANIVPRKLVLVMNVCLTLLIGARVECLMLFSRSWQRLAEHAKMRFV